MSDPLHMLPRDEQTRILKNLKPFVDNGGRLIVIAAGHRAAVIPTLVPNMAGAFQDIEFSLWKNDRDLAQIALDGWPKLNFAADEDLALKLAQNSFGSPQIMQRLSGHIIRANGFEAASGTPDTLLRMPSDEAAFFSSILTERSLEVKWLTKLTNGPRYESRARYVTHDHGPADGYRLIMLALREMLPHLTLTHADIQRKMVELTVAKVAIPLDRKNPEPVLSTSRTGETTAKLNSLSKIAARRMDEDLTEKELEEATDDGKVDPVVEYRGKGSSATLHIVDPLFAYALRWWPGI